MKRYKCAICGMEINDNNYDLNSSAFINRNTKDNIKYCPFCGAGERYIVSLDMFKIPLNESLNEETVIILDHASKLEVFNSDFYHKASLLAESIGIKNRFKALSNIELMHARIHSKYAGISLPILKNMDYSKLKGDKLLLEAANKREKHAVEFYARNMKYIENDWIRKIINALSEVEKEHIILTGGSI